MLASAASWARTRSSRRASATSAARIAGQHEPHLERQQQREQPQQDDAEPRSAPPTATTDPGEQAEHRVVARAGRAAPADLIEGRQRGGTVLGGAALTSPALTRRQQINGRHLGVERQVPHNRAPGRTTRRIAAEVSTGGTKLAARTVARSTVNAARGRHRRRQREQRAPAPPLARGVSAASVPQRGRPVARWRRRIRCVGGQHIANLLPGIVHVGFGIGLDHVGAEARRDAEARIEVELVDPVLIVAAGVPSRSVSSRWVSACQRP